MFKCFKMDACKNYSSKCFECQSMADIYNHYPCFIDTLPNPADMFELITRENLRELKPGEWIWDDMNITRTDHSNRWAGTYYVEPTGFRQIDILDPNYDTTPFKLSTFDDGNTGYTWELFEENRFFRFKKER